MTLTLAPTATLTLTLTSITPTITASHKLWDSPFHYLAATLISMLFLIAFALLIIALYYKMLMTQSQNQHGGNENLEKEGETQMEEQVKVNEANVFVIMAGDEKPTFLATPVCPKSFSLEADNVGNHLE
ncbi:hypothetical protein Lal_00003200 [Lupinus albus]|nr:hypothetical protein Lal_00003200 [Lupinus albus]